jgi:uncharacterized damage-inducible protein DinB
MDIQQVITNYVNYNYWANETLINWLKAIDRKLLYEKTPSSFPGIDLTMQHMIHSQNFWLAVLTRKDYMNLDERIRVNEADWTMGELISSSRRMIDTYSAYSEVELLEQVQTPDNFQSRFEFIFHGVGHGAYHRGQIVTMARALGVTTGIPTTDYDVYLWMRSGKS